MNASDFVGAVWKMQYCNKSDNRLVYCHGYDHDIIQCWDFTRNGYRNFTVTRIDNSQKVDSTIIPMPSKCPASTIDLLITSYRKDGAYTFYDKTNNKLVVVAKEEPALKEKMEGATNKMVIPWRFNNIQLFECEGEFYAVWIGSDKTLLRYIKFKSWVEFKKICKEDSEDKWLVP